MKNSNANTHVWTTVDGIDHAVSEAELQTVLAAVEAVLQTENAQGRYASIVLTNDEVIHEYNRDYRSIDRATDVLSFPCDEGDALFAPPDGFLGDIMISIPTAERQANELGHSTERELAFLTVHGMLHLLGYDHIVKAEEEIMLARQRLIMNETKLKEL
ncbi:MAG: rRNA maturation RNase YbeY [Clostridia bacterium]|nr:rRNA maturation RNase YbeY [Clostridia bacterium]